MITKEQLMKTMLDLVSAAGISGTKSENLSAKKIHEVISTIHYFKENPQNLNLIALKDDIYKRNCVSAFFESSKKTNKTIIILGHLDVVDVEEFGHLKDYAFNPLEYTKRVHELKLNEEALSDLKSGDWIFGRGVADMKYGLTLGIEFLRELSNRADFEGNILFLAVPGEETNSEGMLRAVEYITELKDEKNLEYLTMFIPECYAYNPEKMDDRYIHVGAVGKIMPLFFFSGKETHADEPFNGIDPILLASELNRLLELNTDFCQYSKGLLSPPPICLKLTDLKDLYSAQTSLYAASYYNITALDLSYDDLMSKLKNLCTEAFNNSIDLINKNAKRFKESGGELCNCYTCTPNILTFKELYEKVKKIEGSKLDCEIEKKVSAMREQEVENQTIAIKIIKEVYEKYNDKTPTIVIGFAPPYYPENYPDIKDEKVSNMFNLIDNIIGYSQNNLKESFLKKDYYMVSDLSYTKLSNPDSIEPIFENMPGAGLIYSLPVDSLLGFDVPAMILGPFGKDFHKYSERLNIPFSFDVLPKIYEYAIYSAFGDMKDNN